MNIFIYLLPFLETERWRADQDLPCCDVGRGGVRLIEGLSGAMREVSEGSHSSSSSPKGEGVVVAQPGTSSRIGAGVVGVRIGIGSGTWETEAIVGGARDGGVGTLGGAGTLGCAAGTKCAGTMGSAAGTECTGT